MRLLKRISQSTVSILLTAFLLVVAQGALAQGNSGHAHGKNKNIGVGNASDGIKASIVTSKRIYYTGDPLQISVHFARGAELLSGGDVAASVVIFSPVTESSESAETDDSGAAADTNALMEALVVPLTVDTSTDTLSLFTLEEVDIGTLPAGTYQLGLVLTKPEGDPLNINDWYRGLLGLVNVVGLTITDSPVDFDDDGDGMVDNDSDGDGFSDDNSSD
ncbi:MAG: hypothetical protein H7A06_03110 [Pseudomonadales bacterium]|nr:hypothetical protein [Pseudomonadales bacterium]